MLARNFHIFCLLLLCVGLVGGCGRSEIAQDNDSSSTPANQPVDEHADPHDVPLTEAEVDQLRKETATWSAAVEHVQSYRDTIEKETTEGVPAHAHRSLDLLDYVLQWLPEIAQNSNVPKGDWQIIGENSEKLRDLFNKVHANIDDGKATGYETVAAEIDVAVVALAAING